MNRDNVVARPGPTAASPKTTPLLEINNVTLQYKTSEHLVTATRQVSFKVYQEANAYIAANHKGAAETFLRISQIKISTPEVEQILADPDTQFSTTPVGLMDYVTFMDKAKIIKTRPAKWSDMVVPEFQGRKGTWPGGAIRLRSGREQVCQIRPSGTMACATLMKLRIFAPAT